VRYAKGEQPNQDSTRYVGGGKRPWVKYFNLKGEEFCIGTYGLSRLLKEFNTPFYVYDAGVIREKFLETEKIFAGFDLFYSLKANPNLSICSLFRSIGANAEVASMGELYFALKAGFRPQQILFVGPGKTDEELEYAINSNIYAIVIESSNELERAEKLGRRLNKEINALIRINTHENAKSTVGETMAGAYNRHPYLHSKPSLKC
jgi:diaminopimelate decarboxylase